MHLGADAVEGWSSEPGPVTELSTASTPKAPKVEFSGQIAIELTASNAWTPMTIST